MFKIAVMKNQNQSKLRTVLREKGISPAEFGRMMGDIGSQAVNNWLNRGVPHSKVLAVSQLLGVSPVEIAKDDFIVRDLGPAPKTVEEYVARYGDQWNELPVSELLKLNNLLNEQIAKVISKEEK